MHFGETEPGHGRPVFGPPPVSDGTSPQQTCRVGLYNQHKRPDCPKQYEHLVKTGNIRLSNQAEMPPVRHLCRSFPWLWHDCARLGIKKSVKQPLCCDMSYAFTFFASLTTENRKDYLISLGYPNFIYFVFFTMNLICQGIFHGFSAKDTGKRLPTSIKSLVFLLRFF